MRHPRRSMSHATSVLVLLAASTLWAAPASARPHRQGLLVDCGGPCGALIAKVQSLGAEVTQRYENVEAFAAQVPSDRLAEIVASIDRGQLFKETVIASPQPAGDHLRGGVAVSPVLDNEGGQPLD